MSPSVLVTGASGFVGRALLPMLVEAGHEVHAVHRSRPLAHAAGVHAHRADLLDPAEAEGLVETVRPTHLVHLAWYTTPGRYWTSERNLEWTEASLRLLRAFAAAGGERAVVAGTCAEYDLADGRCSEARTPLRPNSLYGTCKDALRRAAAAHARTSGYSLAWARLFHPYGPAERPERLVPHVVRGLLAGEPVELSDGHQRRDFVYVDDVAAALALLLDASLDGPVNVGTGTATSLRTVVAAVAERAGAAVEVRFGAREPDPADPPLIVAEESRLRTELGWSPAVTLEEGLERTVRWWSRAPTR